LERPTKGNVLFDSEDIFTFNEEKLANFRNNTLGFVFQFHHLLPEFTALENVMMPALIKGQSLKNCRSKAKEILIEVGLEGRLNHKPAELSGGEQQRVAVGRSLMNNPQLVLADEPSGNLDETNGKILHELLIQLSERRGVTFVIATHNPDLAARAKTKIHLVDGQIVSD
jgi:lipoprotein-releasing system ATP-binding protein